MHKTDGDDQITAVMFSMMMTLLILVFLTALLILCCGSAGADMRRCCRCVGVIIAVDAGEVMVSFVLIENPIVPSDVQQFLGVKSSVEGVIDVFVLIKTSSYHPMCSSFWV